MNGARWICEWATRRMILDGLQKHSPTDGVSPEMLAATLSWAIYGAAKEWLRTPGRAPSDEIADTVMRLVVPVFGAAHAREAVA